MNGVNTFGDPTETGPAAAGPALSASASGRTWDAAAAPDAVRLARRFEAEWRSAPPTSRRPELNVFLAEAGSLPGAKLALLRTDMAMRWESGEKVDVGWYLSRFPGLEGETLVALIYEEYCLREESEEMPAPDDYLARYPEVSSQLRRVLDIHGLVGSGQTSMFQHQATPAVAFPQAGETIAGFRLVEELGRGAFARVFLAEERQLADRPVALKVARTGSREPQTLARLQHTHIVPVHSYRTDPATNLHLLCMPFFGRLTLARVLGAVDVPSAKTGTELVEALDRLGPEETAPTTRPLGRSALARRSFPQAIAWWGARMAEALEHAHARGVLHRDVKPSNVLITSDGMPMLLDFNLARLTALEVDESERVAPGGTLDYMSPEHLAELTDGLSDRVGPRSDVYGLGVLLHEAVMGSKPFPPPKRISSGTELLVRAAEDRRAGAIPIRAARPDLPAALEAVILRCLAPNPDDRYASAADLALDLQAVADDRPLKVAREPIVHRLYRATRRNRRALIAAVPILVASVVISTLLVREKKNAEARMASYEHQCELAGEAYKAGLDSEHVGNYDKAENDFASAENLAKYPDPGRLTRALAGSRGQADTWRSLAQLKELAHRKKVVAKQALATRKKAQEFFEAAVPLRFLLTGFGRDPSSASYSVMQAIQPFRILGDEDWRNYRDLTLLAPGQQDQLEREVNEVLFLWVVLLERSGKPDELQLASEICTKALRFVTPTGPWRALQARLEHRPAFGTRPPDERSALACFQWGMLADLETETDEAITWYRKAVDRDPRNYWYHYYLAFAYDKHPNGAEAAFTQYEAAFARTENSPWVRFCRARIHRRRQNFGEAKKEFERALSDFHRLEDPARYPEFEQMTRLEMGYIRQSLGDLAGARADFDWVVAADPTSRYAYAARLDSAHVDAALGQFARALEIYDRLIADDPSDIPARRGRALTLMLQWRTRDAEEELTHLLDCAKADRLVALPERAYARLVLGKPAEALADINEAIAITLKPSARLDRLRTRILLALGRVDDLVLTRPEEIDALPGQGAPLRADLLRIAARLDSKVRTEKNVPSALRALTTRAVVLSALGGREHFAEAEKAASRVIALAPNSARPYLTRALVRHRAGDWDLAHSDVKQALEYDPVSPIAWELLGVLKTEAGDALGGLADLERAKNLSPRGRVRTAMAVALMALNRPKDAVREWSAAIAFDDEDPAAYLGRAEAFLALKKDDQAIADLERAAVYWVEGRPTFGLRLAWTYARCLGARPYLFPRLVALSRRTLASIGSGEAAVPSMMRPL